MKNVLSTASLKARKQLLTALCFQMTIPSMLICFPLVFILVGIVANVNEINLISNIAMPMISLHTFANSITAMFILTPYQKAIFKIIKKILRLKEKPKTNVIENSTKSYTIATIRNRNTNVM